LVVKGEIGKYHGLFKKETPPTLEETVNIRVSKVMKKGVAK